MALRPMAGRRCGQGTPARHRLTAAAASAAGACHDRTWRRSGSRSWRSAGSAATSVRSACSLSPRGLFRFSPRAVGGGAGRAHPLLRRSTKVAGVYRVLPGPPDRAGGAGGGGAAAGGVRWAEPAAGGAVDSPRRCGHAPTRLRDLAVPAPNDPGTRQRAATASSMNKQRQPAAITSSSHQQK